MDASIEKWPDFCFEGNRVSIPKMIKELKRYGYLKEVEGGVDVHTSLKTDYPELFEFLMGYMISQTTDKIVRALEQKKVRVTFDEHGNKRYEFEEDAFEVD